MPSEPIIIAIRDNMVAALEAMSTATGYHYDYAEDVVVGGSAVFDKGAAHEVPRVYLEMLGELGGDPLEGAERAYRTYTRWVAWEVSVPIGDVDTGDHEAKASRVQMDIHTAIMADPTRGASGGTLGRPRTTDLSDLDWEPVGDPTDRRGGVLKVRYATRYDHIRGDMSNADH